MLGLPPANFDEAFFAWLDRASDELSIDFASQGGLTDSEIRQVEEQLGFSLPTDIRRFYARYSIWAVCQIGLRGKIDNCESNKGAALISPWPH